MAEKPTGWLTAKIRVNVNRKNEGPGATPYGFIVRELMIPTAPAMPDHVDIDIAGHKLIVKTHPLGWDDAAAEYRVGDMTLVLLGPEIAALETSQAKDFHRV